MMMMMMMMMMMVLYKDSDCDSNTYNGQQIICVGKDV